MKEKIGVNTASNFYIQDGGQIVRATQHPRMKEALEWINKLYSEGLIDLEFITNKTEQLDNKCLQGTVGIRFDIWNVAYRMYEQLEVQQNDPNAEWVSVYGKMRKTWDSDYWYGKYDKYAEDLEDASTENNVLNNIAEGFTPGPISKQYGGDLSRCESEMIIKFITGEESSDNWDEYVKTANETYHASEINQEILDSLKAYGRIK